MRIEGSVALVSGANRGIGLSLARELRQRGAAKVYAAVRAPHTLREPGVTPVYLDVTDVDAVRELTTIAGDVTLLVNNAGVAHAQNLVDGDIELIRSEIETNVFGLLNLTRAFAPVLQRHGGGAILNVLSAASWFTYPGSGSYAVSKAAAWSLTTGVRNELAAQGTQVTGVHVGMVDTDMSAAVELPKMATEEFARIALDGLEAGSIEVVADDMSRRAKAALIHPPSASIP